MTAQPDSMIVREATAGDLPWVAKIYGGYVLEGTASFELIPPDAAEMRARFAAVRAAGLPYLIAAIDGEIAGYAYAGAYRSRPAYRYTIEDSVYVAPQWCGRGVGRMLLESLIARCEAGPWRQMVAVIGDSANTASIGLHRRCGFELTGTLKSVGFKFGRWVDSVLMQRALGAGDRSAPV